MANKGHGRTHDEDFRTTLQQIDDLCREAERVRSNVEESLRNRAFWPDRRRHPRWSENAHHSQPKPGGGHGSGDAAA